MAKKLETHLLNQKGFTLMEVMIAVFIFSIFVAAYVTSQGEQLSDSAYMKEELKLKELAELKINEIMIDPPELNSALTSQKETKKFENEPSFTYTTEYAALKIPDLSKVFGVQDDSESGADQTKKKILEKVGKNLEEMIWQLRVTTTNTDTDFTFSLSTWLYKEDAKIDIQL